MKLDNLRGDIFGGLTAGIVALPLALGFGVASGLGPAAGLYGAIVLGICAALFGGTKPQISGPTGPMTVVSATVVATYVGDPVLIFATFVLAGVFEILMGFLRLGKCVHYIPYPVVSGFMSGIGVIIILLQLYPFVGHPTSPDVLAALEGFGQAVAHANWAAAAIATLTIVVVYVSPRLIKGVPGTLVALFVGTFVAIGFKLDIPTIGEIPRGFPELHLPLIGPSEVALILIPALTLAALSALDSLLTSVVADNLTKTRHDSDRELIGQGIGNMIVGIVGGIPGAGATMRTVVNIRSGGRGRLSGVLHGFVLLAILFALGPYASRIPMAVLAGILITVGIGIIDYRGLKHFRHVPVADTAVMVTVLLLTVFVDLLQAVAVGMIMASLLFIKRMSDLLEERAQPEPFREQESPWRDEQDLPAEFKNKVYIQHIDGPLFFGFASAFQQMIDRVSDLRAVVIRMKRVPHIDQSGGYALQEVASQLKKRGVPVLITGIQKQPRELLTGIRLIPELIPTAHVFNTFQEAVDWLKDHHFLNTRRSAVPPRGDGPQGAAAPMRECKRRSKSKSQ